MFNRWLKSWGANIASERKQRIVAKKQLDAIPAAAENVPFSFDLKNGGQELRPAPLAYITNLPDTIFHLLDEKKRLKQ